MTENIITVVAEKNEKRIDSFLAEKIDGISRSSVKNSIEKGNILLNGKVPKASDSIKAGDVITVALKEAQQVDIVAQNIPIDIVYEDGDIAVINKAQGMVTHVAPGNYEGTLVNAIMYHIKDLSGINGELRPGIVHRLDKNTSGLIVIAKNDIAHNSLAEQIKNKDAKRFYRAIVNGNIKEDSGMVDKPIGRHKIDRKKMAIDPNGRDAVTLYKVLERFGDYTYIECELKTGRTHQIRVHMKSINHPVVGDDVYCRVKDRFGLKGQLLHAARLCLTHPVKNEYMEFCAPLPDYFEKVLRILREGTKN